jgi:hypothetical protein
MFLGRIFLRAGLGFLVLRLLRKVYYVITVRSFIVKF